MKLLLRYGSRNVVFIFEVTRFDSLKYGFRLVLKVISFLILRLGIKYFSSAY